MAASAANVPGVPQCGAAMPPANCGRSRVGKDDYCRAYPAPGMDLRAAQSDPDSGAQGAADPMAKRTLREVQPGLAHIRRGSPLLACDTRARIWAQGARWARPLARTAVCTGIKPAYAAGGPCARAPFRRGVGPGDIGRSPPRAPQ